jgi:hypothetical protein
LVLGFAGRGGSGCSFLSSSGISSCLNGGDLTHSDAAEANHSDAADQPVACALLEEAEEAEEGDDDDDDESAGLCAACLRAACFLSRSCIAWRRCSVRAQVACGTRCSLSLRRGSATIIALLLH